MIDHQTTLAILAVTAQLVCLWCLNAIANTTFNEYYLHFSGDSDNVEDSCVGVEVHHVLSWSDIHILHTLSSLDAIMQLSNFHYCPPLTKLHLCQAIDTERSRQRRQ